ncbi:endonuclease domain-containing protein [Roseomonas genomospecies 6]|uniref:Endonuclease domain-containing protein n=1 Tax=Roseomonas genomospecies 6 TaxID=214106 RepID=A0A9W7NM87_9PROT|nr:endonuclease domain-containing protein [Roseomonas genomospecies 6]KAA0682810.1 endonuclease domain-containing protein [Roseomonas genomospecies 6]
MAYTPATTKRQARDLRSNPTDAERKLWSLLRGRQLAGHRFRRQHPVPPFILDFACVEARLAVEADGGQHNGSERDEQRDRILADLGWRVLRFWNPDILATPDAVAETVLATLLTPTPVPEGSPSAAR